MAKIRKKQKRKSLNGDNDENVDDSDDDFF